MVEYVVVTSVVPDRDSSRVAPRYRRACHCACGLDSSWLYVHVTVIAGSVVDAPGDVIVTVGVELVVSVAEDEYGPYPGAAFPVVRTCQIYDDPLVRVPPVIVAVLSTDAVSDSSVQFAPPSELYRY
jgi:hypothetical protein